MTTAVSDIIGFPPKVVIAPVVKDPEQAKYEKMWENPDYRNFAPGEHTATTFLQLAKPAAGDKVIDFGAGTGRGALMLALLGNLDVTMVDFATNCLDEDVRDMLTTQSHVMHFKKADLRKEIGVYAKWGYCTDVMEHLPPEDVDKALTNILKSAQYVFFQISTEPDHFGQTIGEHLHLTVRPFEWWEAKLKSLDAAISWSFKGDGLASFFVTGWALGTDITKYGTVNTEHEVIKEQIAINVARNLKEVRPHKANDLPMIILAGGPSMNNYVDEIKAKRAEGYKLVTLNNAYNWALEHGLEPSAQVMVDAREFNKRFISKPIDNCLYMLSSQCHPSVFDAVPADQTYIWHSALSEDILDYLGNIYKDRTEPWFPVVGGSTIMLRALPLMYMLGYRNFHVYGFDSCLMDGQHHAYEQPENDGGTVLQVLVNGRAFAAHPWMASQAQEFLDLMQLMSEDISNLQVFGDGLIAHIIQTAADLEDLEIKQEE